MPSCCYISCNSQHKEKCSENFPIHSTPQYHGTTFECKFQENKIKQIQFCSWYGAIQFVKKKNYITFIFLQNIGLIFSILSNDTMEIDYIFIVQMFHLILDQFIGH